MSGSLTVNRRTRSRRRANQRKYAAAMITMGEACARAEAEGLPGPRGIRPEDALMEVLSRATRALRYAGRQADALSPDEFWQPKWDRQGNRIVEPHPWIQLEERCRHEVAKLADAMASLGIAERQLALDQQRAALVVEAIRDAAVEAGVDEDTLKKMGTVLRERVALAA